MTTPRDWDAASYHRVSGPMEAMGAAVVERLPLRGDETVLDAGCGTGRVTALLAERLPSGRVIALDASPSMVDQARAHLAPDRVDVRVGDLLELDLREEVDAVLSTATFHWVLDHARLFARLFAALRSGGRLVAQCGGDGNIAAILAAADAVGAEEPFAGSFAGWSRPSYFATPGDTTAALDRAGFVDISCWLEERPVQPESPIEYLSTITCGAHLDRLAEQHRGPFVARVAERLGSPLTVGYVRLNIDARRPPAIR